MPQNLLKVGMNRQFQTKHQNITDLFSDNISIKLFADDIKIYMEIDDYSQTTILQQYVDGVMKWAKNEVLGYRIINVNICVLLCASRILQIVIH